MEIDNELHSESLCSLANLKETSLDCNNLIILGKIQCIYVIPSLPYLQILIITIEKLNTYYREEKYENQSDNGVELEQFV
jgi:hypothetical protein